MSYEPWKVMQKVRPPEPVLTQREKLRRFLIGFLGWFLVTNLVWVPAVLYIDSQVGFGETLFSWMLGFGFVANMLTLLLLATRYRRVAVGIHGAIATNLVIALILDGFPDGLIAALFSLPFTLYFLE